MWKNSINGKRYIGSSDNLKRRFSEYFNENYLLRNQCMAICCALLKHGYSKFSLIILEYCEISELLTKEKYYLAERKLFTPEYNIAKDPTAPMSGRKHSDKTISILSEANTGEKNPMFGKNHSDETKKTISEANKGKTHSDETKQIISDARKDKTHNDETKKNKSQMLKKGKQNPSDQENHLSK